LTTDEWHAALNSIEAYYDIGNGFLLRLLKEDDWSFVIKAHALVEAAVSQLLTHHAGDSRLAKIFEQLEHANTQTGKLAFIKALQLLTDAERRFLREFAELRNDLVHNVHNVRFRFADYIAEMDRNQQAAFTNWATYWVAPEGQSAWRQAALRDPRHVLWVATLSFVGECIEKTSEAKNRHAQIDRALSILEILDSKPNDSELSDGEPR
jgi:hypothetical protein